MPQKQRKAAPLIARQGTVVCGLALLGYFVCLGLVQLAGILFPALLWLEPGAGWQETARLFFWNAMPNAAFLPPILWGMRRLRPGPARFHPGVLPTSLGPPWRRPGVLPTSLGPPWRRPGVLPTSLGPPWLRPGVLPTSLGPPWLDLRSPRAALPRGFAPLFLGLSMLASTAGGLLGRALGMRSGAPWLPERGVPLAAAFLALCVLPALAEEVFFRGLLRAALRPFGPGAAVLGTALLFALSHGSLPQCFTALISGLALAFCAELCGSVWPGAALHLANNALAFAAAWLELYADPDTAGIFTLTAALLTGFWCAASLLPRTRRSGPGGHGPSREASQLRWALPRAKEGEPGARALFADPAFRITLACLALLAAWRCAA